MKKKRANYLVGLFSLLAVGLLMVVLYFLGSTTIFSSGDRFILYFNESVNGLNIGAPVKLRGVPVGNVSNILVDARNNPPSGAVTPVIIEIRPERLYGIDGNKIEFKDKRILKNHIQRGLRGRIQLLSFITGQSYVELDYESDEGQKATFKTQHYGGQDIAEIPTTPSAMAQLSEILKGLKENVMEIDFKGIGLSVDELLTNLNTNLSGDRIGKAFEEATDLVAEVRALLQREEFKTFLADLESSMNSVRSITAQIDTRVDPLTQNIEEFIVRAQTVLDRFDTVLVEIGIAAQPESSARLGFEETLESVNKAARSLSQLLEFLERNPDALVKGRKHGNEN